MYNNRFEFRVGCSDLSPPGKGRGFRLGFCYPKSARETTDVAKLLADSLNCSSLHRYLAVQPGATQLITTQHVILQSPFPSCSRPRSAFLSPQIMAIIIMAADMPYTGLTGLRVRYRFGVR
jgi:hypothetical protein